MGNNNKRSWTVMALNTAGVLITLGLSGCVGPLVPIQALDQAGPKAQASRLKMVTSDEAKAMAPIGPLEGYSCKNKLWDPTATAEAAEFQLQILAAQRGAKALSNLRCVEGGTSVNTNCWQSFMCTAEGHK